MSRFFKFSLIITALAGLCLLYGFFIEPKLLKIRYVTIKSQNYQGDVLHVALLSDIHIGGPHVPASRVETIIARVNELRPDVILIPGDFINGHKPRSDHSAASNEQIDEGLAALAELEAPFGVFTSIGNHDVWYDAEHVEKELIASGLTVLKNRAVNLSNGSCMIGLADHDTQTEDPKAYYDCEEGAFPIVIAHSPDSFALLRSDTALAVAGHTHGGQINIPLVGRRVTATAAGKKYAYGIVDVSGVPAFVTAGIGTSILPARFRAPPEIVLIKLSSRP